MREVGLAAAVLSGELAEWVFGYEPFSLNFNCSMA